MLRQPVAGRAGEFHRQQFRLLVRRCPADLECRRDADPPGFEGFLHLGNAARRRQVLGNSRLAELEMRGQFLVAPAGIEPQQFLAGPPFLAIGEEKGRRKGVRNLFDESRPVVRESAVKKVPDTNGTVGIQRARSLSIVTDRDF